jgi:hypothetical protein
MRRAERTRQRIVELEQDWKYLTTRIQAIRGDLSLATDGERQVVLQERLDALTEKRSDIEAELDGLEQELHSPNVSRGVQCVFISYKRHTEPDDALAMYLTRFLSGRGSQVFIDQRLKAGMDWVNEVRDQIARSDFLVVLLSPASMKSEMVFEEVRFADMQWRETGRPRILPVRVDYKGPLSHQLDAYLRPLQYILWTGEEDTPVVARRILNAMEGRETFRRYAEPLATEAAWQPISKSTADGRTVAEPYSYFDPRLILEAPGGVVDLESPFYVERRADARLKRELGRSGTTTTIRAARQMGKTSLLVRGVEHARQQGSPIAFFDFQMVDTAYLQDLEAFLHYMALNVAAALKIEPEKVEAAWQTPLSPKDRLTHFVEDHVLQDAAIPVTLAIDEADRLFDTAFRQEFFSLIRAWNTKSGFNPLWKKLNVAMVISTQPFLLIDDINQSPFNVGLRIELEDFTPGQVRDLNARHGVPLDEAELAEMMTFLGGHPYLVRQALYTLVDQDMTWNELVKIAAEEAGPFSTHLRHYLWQLRDQSQLVGAIKDVLKKQTCSDEIVLTRLIAAGLVRQDEDGQCRCRCHLYEHYFGRYLL